MITDDIFPFQAIKCTILSPDRGPNVEAGAYFLCSYFCCFKYRHRHGALCSLINRKYHRLFPVITHLGTSSSDQLWLVPILLFKFNYLGRPVVARHLDF